NRTLQQEARSNPVAAKEYMTRKAFSNSTVQLAEFYADHVFNRWPEIRLHPGDEAMLARALSQKQYHLAAAFVMRRLVEESIARNQTNWEMLTSYLELVLRHVPTHYPEVLKWLKTLEEDPPLMRQQLEIERIR